MRLIFGFATLIHIFDCVTAWHGINFEKYFDGLRISSRSYKPSKAHWFSQQLNHFSPIDNRVWKQRYFVNDDYYQPNGSNFLFIGAEAPANDIWVRGGQMFDNAKVYGARMFLLEHRFYGLSQPTLDLSVENLAYLSAEQALLDLAYFIEEMNKDYQIAKGTKWIVFGCSYAGSLAAWMRAKYPHLVHAAVSSSAPLLAKVDYPEYIMVMEESLKTHSQACIDVISTANKEMEKMLGDPLGRQKLEKLFNLCDPIDPKKTSEKDIANLYGAVMESLAFIVQYNKGNRNGHNITIDTICDIMVDEKKGVPVSRLAEMNNLIFKLRKEKCFDYKYDKMIDELRNVTWANETGAVRQWTYQTCTEFGFYATSNPGSELFGDKFPIELFLQQCTDIFGPQFTSKVVKLGVERTNTIFGALDLEDLVSNVVFVHGSIDPWHSLGIIKSRNPRAPAIFISGTSHCADIYPQSENDSPQLVEARKQVTQLIGQWLDD